MLGKAACSSVAAMASDDDAPLSALAKTKPKLQDDDMPLSALGAQKKPPPPKAGKGAGKAPGRPSASGAAGSGRPSAGGAAAKPGAKAAPKRKRASSSSSSSSSSDSSSSSAGGATKRGKRALLKKKSTGVAKEEEDGAEKGAAFKKKGRDSRDEAVAELLCRWWYVLPDWPPNDPAYYEAELTKRRFRKVKIEEWEWVPEEDQEGRKKVYELTQFRGLYRASNGDLIDVRPQDTCPCYRNLSKKDPADVYDMLIKAYENQIEDLKNSQYDEKKLKDELNVKLNRVRSKASNYKATDTKKKKG